MHRASDRSGCNMMGVEHSAFRSRRSMQPMLLLLLCLTFTVARGEGTRSPPTPPVEQAEAGRGRSPSQWFAPLPST
jgi:hypothetical protein